MHSKSGDGRLVYEKFIQLNRGFGRFSEIIFLYVVDNKHITSLILFLAQMLIPAQI